MPFDFPSSPTNGQQSVQNGITYAFNSTQNTWLVFYSTDIIPSIQQTANASLVISQGSFPQANLGRTTANSAFDQANAAFIRANSSPRINVTISTTAPSSPVLNDLWIDTT